MLMGHVILFQHFFFPISFGEPKKFHHSIVQRIGKKLFIRFKLSVRL
jgi:hypothetical protein